MYRNSATNAWLIVMATAWASAARADAEMARHAVEVEASVPTVEVAARSDAPRTLRLPTLQYAFTLDVFCAKPYFPESVSITVADSRVRLDSEQILEQTEVTGVALTVPADQIGPLNAGQFCRPARPESEPSAGQYQRPAGHTLSDELTKETPMTLSVAGALTAAISLRCSDGQQEEMVYVSRSLDVILECRLLPTETAVSSPTNDSE